MSLQFTLTTPEGRNLIDAILDRNGGTEGLPVECQATKERAATLAALRMLDQTPDARQRIADELQRFVDDGEAVNASKAEKNKPDANTEWKNEGDFDRWASDDAMGGRTVHRDSPRREVRAGDSVCCWSFSNKGVVVEASTYSLTFKSPEGKLYTTCYEDVGLIHVGPPAADRNGGAA